MLCYDAIGKEVFHTNSIEIGNRLGQRRKELGMTLDDIATEIGVARSTIQRYEKGTIKTAKMPVLEAISRVLHVNPSWLCGKSEDMEVPDPNPARPLPSTFDNILLMPTVYKVPLVGTIACGKPILAVEEAGETVAVPEWVRADFALRCKGDSMINARIFDGDTVYIKSQPEVENGQIAAVRVGEEATLKKVYYAPESDRITLRACNPLYPDLVYEGETLNEIEILGLAVGFYSDVRHEQ